MADFIETILITLFIVIAIFAFGNAVRNKHEVKMLTGILGIGWILGKDD